MVCRMLPRVSANSLVEPKISATRGFEMVSMRSRERRQDVAMEEKVG
jgi:hypothetical protein